MPALSTLTLANNAMKGNDNTENTLVLKSECCSVV